MQKKRLVWLFNNLSKYEYTNDGLAIKDEFSQLLVTNDTLENEEIREKATECYDKFVLSFYNDILGYQNGLANKNITSSSLDCYFVQTADGYIPIGLYKEERPAETSAMVQMYLEQCKTNIKQDRNRAIVDWQKDISVVSEKYKTIKESKNPSLLKAIVGIFFSIPVLMYGILNLINSRFYDMGVFQTENANVVLENYSLLKGTGKTGIISLICICSILVLIAVIALVNSVKEILLIQDKKNTVDVLNDIHARVNEIEKGTTVFLENSVEQCFNAARKGENILVKKNANAALIEKVKAKIKKALGYVNKTEKDRSAIGTKTFTLVTIAYVSVFVLMFVHMPKDSSNIMSDSGVTTTNISEEQTEMTDKVIDIQNTVHQSNEEDAENDLEINNADDIIRYTSTNQQTDTVIQSPTFITYSDEKFGFEIDYPSHFNIYNLTENTVSRVYMSNDGAAVLKINAGYNKGNITCKQLCNELINAYTGEVTYNPVKDTWFALSINDSDNYHYAYYKLDEGEIRGFEFHFKGAENLDTYSKYIDHIYASFKKK